MVHDSKYDWGKDWRGTPIEPGAVVVYHAQTKGGKTVEAEVVSITDGDDYRGKTIMVRPLRESGIAVARPPYFYTREDKKLFAVPQLNVTVIKTAEKSDAEELWTWVTEVKRLGLRLFVTGTDGAIHEFEVPAAQEK